MTLPIGRAARRATLVGGAWALALAVNRAQRRVAGSSMSPGLEPGARVLVVPWPRRRLAAGQLVVVRDPRRPDREAVKRVAATAGAPFDGRPVPAGHVAVTGDNPAASTDSRHFGPVPVGLVVGRAVPLRLPTRVTAPPRS